MAAEPILLGVVDELSPGGPRGYETGLRVGLDEAVDTGRLDRPVELLYEQPPGLPSGSVHSVRRAVEGLLDRGVLAVLGPAVTDNTLAVKDLADRAEVPMLAWPGSEEIRSEWVYHYQAGSLEDEPTLLAEYAASQGWEHIAVVHDTAATGLRMMSFFERAAARLGLRVRYRRGVSALGEVPASLVPDLLESKPDVVVHLGMWSLVPLAEGLRSAAPGTPLLANITASLAQVRTEWLPSLEGCIFIGMSSPANTTAQRYAPRFGVTGPLTTRQVVGLDVGRLAAEALANAPLLSPSGFREGLELIKGLPAAAGQEGTVLGFGHWDRAALKGRYLVLQQYREGQAHPV